MSRSATAAGAPIPVWRVQCIERRRSTSIAATLIFDRLPSQALKIPSSRKPPFGWAAMTGTHDATSCFAFSTYWQQRMRAASIPCGHVPTVGEALGAVEARKSRLARQFENSDLGWSPNISWPFRCSSGSIEDPSPAARIVEHKRGGILTDVPGYADDAASALPVSGVVYGSPEPRLPRERKKRTPGCRRPERRPDE